MTEALSCARDFAEPSVHCLDGHPRPLSQALERTHTDAFVLLHDGELVARYGDAEHVHPLMSVTKSLVGALAGTLLADGTLTRATLVGDVVAELASSYYGVTVGDLLDMRSGTTALEATWELELPSVYGSLMALAPGPGGGGPFAYRSADTDALGWVLERARARAMPQLLTDVLLDPIGVRQQPSFTLDAHGTFLHSSGLQLSALDIARFGAMLAASGSVGDRQVVPVTFLKDTLNGQPDSVQAFTDGVWALNQAPGHERIDLPAGTDCLYRNQFWVPHQRGRQLLCLGIHGQAMLVDLAASVVAVKLSWWPQAHDPLLFSDGLACLYAGRNALMDEDPGSFVVRH